MSNPDQTDQTDEPPSASILTELTTRMNEALTKASTPMTENTAAIGIKLDGSNYALWSQVVEMYISGKDKLGYINGDIHQPPQTDPSFRKWRTDNAIVKGWLINSMDPSLIGNFIRFPTAKLVWDSIATTYFDGSDTSQVYDLRRRVTCLKQAGGSLEKFFTELQGLWREIDFRRPNPMECVVDIQHYNTIIQEDRVYTFLDGLDDRLDNIRGDILQMKPFPTIEQAYAHVRREAVRQAVMISGAPTENSGAVLASKSFKPGQHSSPSTKSLSLGSGKAGTPSRPRASSDGTKCSHCGNSKHIRDTCFKLHGYPEWWNELQARKCQDGPGSDGGSGKAAVATAEPQLSISPLVETAPGDPPTADPGKFSTALCSSSPVGDESSWVVDSGASDHMTFDDRDFAEKIPPQRTCVAFQCQMHVSQMNSKNLGNIEIN